MWQRERLIAQQLDGGVGGRGRARAEGGEKGAKRRMGWVRVQEKEGRGGRREEEGRQRRGVKMGMHANFIILLINFSSSNPPAGTWEQIGDGERLRKSRLILNSHPKQNSVFHSILAPSTFSLPSVRPVFWQDGCLLSLLTKRDGLVGVWGHLLRNKLGLHKHTHSHTHFCHRL